MDFTFAKIVRDGGKGSGNFGHKGRPGQVGGSSKEGGSVEEPSSAELLKVSTDLTLADVDDHLAKVGIRKGDVVKAFGLRKDVLLSHAQNCMKAQAEGNFWRGVFKNEEEVNAARELKAEMEANGGTDTKEYTKLNRSLARYDFVKGLADSMAGGQPATAEPPKAEEPVVVQKVKKEKPLKTETAKSVDLGEVEAPMPFVNKPYVDLNKLVANDMRTPNLFTDTCGILLGMDFKPAHNKKISKVSGMISEFGLAFNWGNKYVSEFFNGNSENCVKGGVINPSALDDAISNGIEFLNKQFNEGDPAVDIYESLSATLGLLFLQTEQDDKGITQQSYDKLTDVSTLKSKLTDAGNRGQEIITALQKNSDATYMKLNKIGLNQHGMLSMDYVDKLSAGFDGVDVIDEGALPDTPDVRSLAKQCYGRLAKSNINNAVNLYIHEAKDFDHLIELMENRAASDYMDLNKALKGGQKKYTAMEYAMSSQYALQGMKEYAKRYGKPKNVANASTEITALSMMSYFASRKLTANDCEAGAYMTSFIREAEPSALYNALVKLAPDSASKTKAKRETKQRANFDRLVTASAKPDLENHLVNTKIENTKQTGNNLHILENTFKFFDKNDWKDLTKGGKRSAHNVSKQESQYQCSSMQAGINDMKQIEKGKKYNDKMLTANELKHLLTAMTIGGSNYTTIKEPNRYGSNNIINMMVACGEIVDAKDVKCIRSENMANNYRNYNFKVGDSITFDAQHASNSEQFAYNEALKMFGEQEPCMFEVVGKYPRLDLEPFVWKDKGLEESEQLMAGFFKVKEIEDGVSMKWRLSDGREGNSITKKVKVEFDWDRLDEYLSLQTRGFADYMGMYGEEPPADKKSKGK